MKNNGGPAFPAIIPFEHSDLQGKDYPDYSGSGMTLRDWFAGQAIAPFMAHLAYPTTSGSAATRACAEWAYEMADAMIAERSK